jgi:hypothetical protein
MSRVNIPGVGLVDFPDTMSDDEIAKAIQTNILPSLKTAPALTDKPADFSAKETALALGQGIVGAGKSLTDVFGAENVASQALGRAQAALGEQFSPERKAEMARREAIQKKAAESGSLTEEISAFLGSVADAPVQSLAQGLGSIVPYVGTGIIGGIAKLGGATVKAINTVLGTAQGAGAVKGSIYDGVRNELINTGMDPKEAEAKAIKAQEYLGGNLLDIIGGAALGGVGARVGVENLLTPGAAAKLDARLLSRAGKAALAEAPLEGAQAGQEQIAVNRALQQAGFDVDTFKGAAGAAARDAAVGALTGAAVGSVRGPGVAPVPPAPPSEEDKTTAPPPPVTPPGGIPPEALDLETLLGAGAPAVDETVDFETPAKTTGMSVDELTADNARIQAKLEAGEYKDPKAVAAAKARIDRQQAEIDALKAQGEKDVIQQTDVGAGGVGTEVPGGSTTTGTAAGVAGAGRPGVAGDQGTELAPQDGEGSEQPALKPSFFRWAAQNKINLPEGLMSDFPELVQQWRLETGQPDETTQVDQEVINQQALADQEAKAAEAAAAAQIEEEARLSAEEQAAIEEEAAAELAGEATPPTVTPTVTPTVERREQAPRGRSGTYYEYVAKDADGKELGVFNTKKEAQLALDTATLPQEEFFAKYPELKAKEAPTKVKTPKEPKAAATTGKKTKAVKAAPVTADYLNSETFYGGASPTAIVNERKANKDNKLDTDPVNVGIMNAGHEIAFDAFDTVDVRGGVNPELKAIAEEKNKAQQVKRQQMRKELSGKKDPETNKPYSSKRLTALVSNIPLYKAGAPLEFLTKEELAAIYRKYVGKRKFVKEEKTTREAQKQNRDKFVEGLNELQKIKLKLVEQRAFTEEVAASTLRKTQTTGADSRKDRVSKTSEELSKELKAIEQKDTETREAAAKQVAEQEVSEEKQLTQELKEFNKAAEKVLPKKQAPKEKAAPSKSKLVTKVENAIVEGDTDSALDAIANEKINERGTRTIAQSFLKLIKNFGGVTIQFNNLPEGEDGLFDPATNTIALSGKDGVYTGKRPIDETVMHEVGHYLIDHVVDNRQAYLESIKDPAKRKEVENALNRLDNNYRFVKDKLGDKFNIPTMKEFLAEIFGNPKFQVAIANLDPYKTPERVEGFTGPRKQFRKFEGGMLQTIVRNIANALGFSSDLEGVTFKEILDDVFKIVSLPTADLRGKEVSYAAQPKAPLTEPLSVVEKKLREDEAAIPPENSAYSPRNVEAKDIKYFKRLLFTKAGWREIASKLQYDRYAIKHWEDVLSLAGKIIREGKNKINNIHEQITLATGRGKNLYNSRVEGIYKELNEGILGLSKALGKGTDVALDMAHRILEARHEPERRLVKYLMAVPLSTTATVQLGKENISAADYRDRIFNALDTKSFTKEQAEKLREALEAVVFTTDANGNRVPNTKYVDPLGRSPAQVTEKDGKIVGVDPDINSRTYNVTGLSLESNAKRLVNYENEVKNNPELKKYMDSIITSIEKLHKVTTDLNKQANYWSQPVTNRVNFYGWDHYVPLKGVSKANQADEMLDLDGDAMGREVGDITPSSKGKGKELQEIPYGLDGRISVSDNPVLQSLSDAVRAAGRAGRKDLTQAIKNSVAKGQFNPDGQGLLEGKVLMNVKFEQRSDPNFLKELPRENTIFHYNEDGSIDVIEINDKKKREAIRRTYKDANSLLNYANNITSFLGQVHTRYNYNFAPLNFVRDALTNAWTLGAEMGPKKSAEFIAAISGNVINKGAFGKAAKIAYLYQKNNTEEIQRLAKADPFVKEMVEFIEEGGMVEYIQGLSLKSNFDRLQKEVGSSMVIRNVRQLNKLIDLWTDMFEITSRASAYSIAKKNFLEEGLSETAARTKAAAYSKNLANFEQVGEHGRGLGALFMFFRPSATGAVRAIEAALPAFQKLEKGSFGFGNPVMNELPPNLTDAEKATYKKNFLKRQKASRYMLTYLMSLGALSYTMAAMMADEDDLGRNKLMKDDMGQWTRFLRFHTPFSDKPFQVPWGFGLGSFMASGAQLAAVASGHQSIGSALGNIATQISLDSFVPIPFSRMKIEDNPAMFMLDSITPSMLRPAFQFVVNKNGLGQDIYNDSNRRMGSAYLGGDNIPQTYKVLATNILDTFGIDVSPNSLYFLANSYVDGPARVVDLFVNSVYLMADQKEFNAKTDIPFIGSFIGAAPNVDGREFNSITEQVEKMAGRMNMLEKANPDEYLKYLDKNPLHEEIVEFFDKNIGELNKLRKETNEVRIEPGLSPKERTQLIRELNEEQNLLKYDLIQQFKAYYNLKP